MNAVQPVLTITLNPALDLTTSVGRLEPRQKLRCEPPRYDPGGGGINVSRAIRKLGGDSLAFVALGGATGAQLRALLDEEGVAYTIYDSRGETRISFTVVDRSSDRPYRFVLPGPEQSGEEDRLLAALADCIGANGFRYIVYIVASGSLPPGLAPEFWARLAGRVDAAGARFMLDTSGPALEAAGRSGLFLIKPNREEAQALLGDRAGAPESDAELARALAEQGIAEIVVLTLGRDGAIVAAGDRRFRLRSPDVEVRSTVGAGDSFLAALTLGLARDWSLEDSCRYGIAAAASTVTTEGTELCERAQTERFFEESVGTVEPLE